MNYFVKLHDDEFILAPQFGKIFVCTSKLFVVQFSETILQNGPARCHFENSQNLMLLATMLLLDLGTNIVVVVVTSIIWGMLNSKLSRLLDFRKRKHLPLVIVTHGMN